MNFDDLTALLGSIDLPSPEERRLPPRDRVREVQRLVASGLADEEFRLDCLERHFAALQTSAPRDGMIPFHVMPEAGARVALAYWGPGVAAGPHEHTDWTVTGVLHNELAVQTFDRDVARRERKLVVKNHFPAGQGLAGHIYDPCIHNPFNPTREWSISIHIFGPNDRPVLADEVGEIPGLSRAPGEGSSPVDGQLAEALAAIDRQRGYRAQVAALSGSPSPRARGHLEALFAHGDEVTRRAVVEAVGRVDPPRQATLRARMATRELRASSELERQWCAVPLVVRRRGAQVSLCLGDTAAPHVLLQTEARAEPALELIAGATRFVVRDLPGGLALADRLALARALVDRGLFTVSANAEPD
jgi:hypothetical protein